MRFERFIRKPVEVDAVHYQGDELDCLKYDSRVTFSADKVVITTPEGAETGETGDWIVRGPMGELNIVKSDEFFKTHDGWEPCPRPRGRKPAEVDNNQ